MSLYVHISLLNRQALSETKPGHVHNKLRRWNSNNLELRTTEKNMTGPPSLPSLRSNFGHCSARTQLGGPHVV